MTDFNQFGSAKPAQATDPRHCGQCEAMLADALDGVLSSEDREFFALHLAQCPSCSSMLADAQRGAAWLELLRAPRPEPPADLVDRILLHTSGQGNVASPTLAGTFDTTRHAAGSLLPLQAPPLQPLEAAKALAPAFPANTLLAYPPAAGVPAAVALGSPALGSSGVLPFRRRAGAALWPFGQTFLQPRLAMTAAMAFFSVALTLNLTGVRLDQLRASDLKPSSLRRSVSQANAHVVRYYDSLRVVYELESRVHDLERSSADAEETAPASSTPPRSQPSAPHASPDNGKQPAKKTSPRPGQGSSLRQEPRGSFGSMRASCSRPRLPYLSPRSTELLPWSPDARKRGERV